MRDVFLVLLVVCVLVDFILVQSSQRVASASEAEVYVYIGPHLSATHHIQEVLGDHRSEIFDAGFCYPENQQEIVLAILQGEGATVKPAERAVNQESMKKCLNQGKKIIISSDLLSQIPDHDGLRRLRDAFGNKKMHIIATYREPLTMSYIWYQEAMHNNPLITTFSRFVSHKYDTSYHRTISLSLFHFAKEFGKEHITIIDFNGMQAAKKGPAYVFVCEIIGIMCSESFPYLENKRIKTFLPSYLYVFVRNHAYSIGCKPAQKDSHLKLMQSYGSLDLTTLPKRDLDLRLFKLSADHIDKAVRGELGSVMLYNNASIARQLRGDFVVTEIDETKFYTTEPWNTWVWKEIK
ncbi:hypothetical protein EON65_57190, partial [archaeon]